MRGSKKVSDISVDMELNNALFGKITGKSGVDFDPQAAGQQ